MGVGERWCDLAEDATLLRLGTEFELGEDLSRGGDSTWPFSPFLIKGASTRASTSM